MLKPYLRVEPTSPLGAPDLRLAAAVQPFNCSLLRIEPGLSLIQSQACCQLHQGAFIQQAGDGVRTRDPQLGKLMLYQLSYSRESRLPKSHWSELNRRPLDYESSALPLSYSGTRFQARVRVANNQGSKNKRNAQRRCAFHEPACPGRLHGAEGSRTPDLCSAIAALSQLSYSPVDQQARIADRGSRELQMTM